MATFPASAFQCPVETVVSLAAVEDSAIGNVGYPAVGSGCQVATRSDGSRGACEHSQPAHALVAIAKARDTCGVTCVVLPGQRDMCCAQPLRTLAERTVAWRIRSHMQARRATINLPGMSIFRRWQVHGGGRGSRGHPQDGGRRCLPTLKVVEHRDAPIRGARTSVCAVLQAAGAGQEPSPASGGFLAIRCEDRHS
jgi:hypothetical protein